MKYGKRPRGRIMKSPILPIILVAAAVVLFRATWKISEKARMGEERLAKAEAELIRLDARRADLAAKVSYLSTDKGIEAEFRTKYRTVKEGESVAVIVDRERQPSSREGTSSGTAGLSATSTDGSGSGIGWLGRLLQGLGLKR